MLTYTQSNRQTFGGHCDVAGSGALDRAWAGVSGCRGWEVRAVEIQVRRDATALRKGRLVETRIEGKYWMYWGEGAIDLAT